jgi:MFS family permease
MGKIRRKNLIIGSNMLLLISTISFMILPAITTSNNVDGIGSPYLFFYLSVCFRVVQGVASAAI